LTFPPAFDKFVRDMAHDYIRLNKMVFRGYHGVWDEERQVGQRFEVECACASPTRPCREFATASRLKSCGNGSRRSDQYSEDSHQ